MKAFKQLLGLALVVATLGLSACGSIQRKTASVEDYQHLKPRGSDLRADF